MMRWILRVAASLLASLGVWGLIILFDPPMHWNLWQGAGIVLTMGYIVWTTSFIITGLYWACSNYELKPYQVKTRNNVIPLTKSRHLSQGPKAS